MISLLRLRTLQSCAALTLVWFLSACQNLQQHPSNINRDQQYALLPQMTHWKAKGKIALRNGKDRQNASFSWEQNGDLFSIHLFGPLGQGSTWINKTATSVSLKASDGTYMEAMSPEDLMQNTLNWQVPISNLQQWVKGATVEQLETSNLQTNEKGYINAFEQQGWQIQYPKYERVKGWFLPTKIVVKQGDMKLIMIVKKWTTQ